MARRLYQTRGLIIAWRNQGETDRVYAFFTERFGLLVARARGVREERSKLRPLLRSWQLLDLGFVLGRRGWRLISAEPIWAKAVAVNAGLSRLGFLLTRLLPPEKPEEKIYCQLLKLLRTEPLPGREPYLPFLLACLRTLGYLDLPTHESLSRPLARRLAREALKASGLF